jgi:secreted Zn-dependent insulinase-like peptidase
VVLITILLILPLIHSEVITIKVNGPSIDISLKQPNLDVSSYQVITLDNGFRLLTIANPTLKGVTTFGVTANVGGLENPPYTRNLNFMLSNYLAAGSQQYPNANEMNEFFAP